jgi:hypothetical protein
MPVNAGDDLSWQTPCMLDSKFLRETKLKLPEGLLNLLKASVEDMFCTAQEEEDEADSCKRKRKVTVPLTHLHEIEYPGGETTMPPMIYRARVQASLSPGTGSLPKDVKKALWRTWKPPSYEAFLAVYRRVITEFVLPQFEEDVLYQAYPILRVVMPGSVAPIKIHMDADCKLLQPSSSPHLSLSICRIPGMYLTPLSLYPISHHDHHHHHPWSNQISTAPMR